jgi:hypothetical protein
MEPLTQAEGGEISQVLDEFPLARERLRVIVLSRLLFQKEQELENFRNNTNQAEELEIPREESVKYIGEEPVSENGRSSDQEQLDKIVANHR